MPAVAGSTSHPLMPSRWRATRRAFLRALAALLGAGALPAVSAAGGRGRWSAWTAAVALADGYWTSPPHEAHHAFNALGALWVDGAPPAGETFEARASLHGMTWT